MFAAAPLPYYSAYRSSTKKRKGSNTSKDGLSAPQTSNPPAASAKHGSRRINDLLEPAVDGPPSPERIRALSKQMKRASILDKHRSTSSGSSSLTSNRPSWEPAPEHLSLSRRSSTRSTASNSMPSKDRPDSVQFFGRAIFHRKGKIKRENSTHSSSGSSQYSGELPLDGQTTPAPKDKDPFIPALFGRRKTFKSDVSEEDVGAFSKRLPISGPYNFQHVTHTRRDHLPALQRASRMELVNEFSTLHNGQPPANVSPRDIAADDFPVEDFPSSGAYHLEDASLLPYFEAQSRARQDRNPFGPRQALPQNVPRRLVRPSLSQEHLRQEQFATEPLRTATSRSHRARSSKSSADSTSAPPIPPPRLSSRQSIRYEGFDPLATTTLERPRTSGGFRHPEPLTISHSPEPPTTSHGIISRSEPNTGTTDRFPHVVTRPDEVTWPLGSPTTASFDAALLPDVPEEDEYALARKSRASMISNNSSLRGSQSVPLLRQAAHSQMSRPPRPPSAGSDTLGTFDLAAAQRALRAAAEEKKGDAALPRSSWEEDIDYCYEHEAEADFYYEWSRPSLELRRDDESRTPVHFSDVGRPQDGQAHGLGISSGLLSTPGQFDVPALSPASQASTTGPEATTPTGPTMPMRSNFSLPRSDSSGRMHQVPPHIRTASHASSFKESHGFNLSPSLLIPGDYRQRMILTDPDVADFPNADTIFLNDLHHQPDDDPTLTLKSADPARASTSTTGTNSSDSSGERHLSTKGPGLKKLTIDSASANDRANWSTKSSWSPASDGEPRFRANKLAKASPKKKQERPKSKGSINRRKPRAKSTSLSTPPILQYSRIPPVYALSTATRM